MAIEQDVVWRPQPRQARALSCPADEVFFGGAAGGGKSDYLLAGFTAGIQYGRHYKGVIFRRSYKELEELQDRAFDLFKPIGGTYLSTVRTWTFPDPAGGDGATLKFRHLESDLDVHDYQGHQYCVGVDTPILMGDGSSMRACEVAVGNEVMTLHGPRKVTATIAPYVAECVSADGQIQPIWHPILTAYGWLSYETAYGWQSYESSSVSSLEAIRYGPEGVEFLYSHPYLGYEMKAVVGSRECVFTPIGEQEVVDFTVDEVNHYINADNHLVNMNTYIAFDELTNWPNDYCYIYMFSRLRSPQGHPCKMRAAGNPGGSGHAWVKKRFIDASPPDTIFTVKEVMNGKEFENTRCFIPSKLEDNLILMENDPRYEQRMAMLSPHLYRALREGDWNVFEGQVFSEFTDKHIVEPFPLDQSWFRFASMDWGYSKPFSIGWWAVTGDERMIRYREWYGGTENVGVQMSAHEVAKRAMELSSPEGVKMMVADPACWNNQGTGTTIADAFMQHGWNLEKGINDRVNGLQNFHSKLKAKGEDGRPQMLIFNTCTDFIRTIPLLPYNPRHPEDVDTTGDDHCVSGFTKVVTDLGEVQIKDLVGTEGKVFTIDGVTDYYDCRLTRKNAHVVDVELDDGRTIRCTPDHKFYTEDGEWVEAANLLGMSLYDTISHLKSHLKNRGAKWDRRLSVGNRSLCRSIQKRKPVRDHAPTVVEVRPAGREDVYCLVANVTHAFAVAGGIVIHNCYDESRYAVMSRLSGTTISFKRNGMKSFRRSLYSWLS